MADETQVDRGIVEMWRKDGWLFGLVGVVMGLALGVIILPAIGALENGDDVRAFLNDLAPELIGILITVFVIDRLNRRRDERNADEALKRQLIMDAGSMSNEKAKDAVHQLRRRGWLEGENGLLRGADLTAANLQEAGLMRANLQGADLTAANLQGADLNYANLQDAIFYQANLQDAKFLDTNLRGAYLYKANLQGTELAGTNLQGAYLYLANLQGVKFYSVEFDESTIQPDEIHWTPETDMTRFTYPNHPNFWR